MYVKVSFLQLSLQELGSLFVVFTFFLNVPCCPISRKHPTQAPDEMSRTRKHLLQIIIVYCWHTSNLVLDNLTKFATFLIIYQLNITRKMSIIARNLRLNLRNARFTDGVKVLCTALSFHLTFSKLSIRLQFNPIQWLQ